MLQKNGRASNARIARSIGVSEGTVRRRLKILVDDEIIQVVAMPNPEKMGYRCEAIIGVQADPDKMDPVAEQLARLEEVQFVTMTTGTYDIFTWVTCPSSDDLGIFLRTKVGTIPGVRRTETFINLAFKKRSYGPPL
ncbi:MAG: Lrp/AsnC family transcriptional regulator [Chloroflexi bacterium]|nr:Lrp/AsnC family transcriptional regulator [Chloroflexota bacterium]